MERARTEYAEIMTHLATLADDHELNDAHVTASDAKQTFTPPPPAEGCVFETYEFGRGGDYVLDLFCYRPEDTTVARPAVVFVHGGGLRSGFPEMHGWQAQALAAAGYVAVSIDYRVYPEALWPGAIEDVKCGVRWVRAHADELGVDPDRIAAVGGSAGGYLTALLALTPGQFEGTGGHADQSSEVRAAVLFYPLTDTRWSELVPEIQQVVADFIGTDDVDVYAEASPSSHVHVGAPPFLILTGDRDREIPEPMVSAFDTQLREAGVRSTLHVFPGRAHAFDFALDDWALTYDLLHEFLDRELGVGASEPVASS